MRQAPDSTSHDAIMTMRSQAIDDQNANRRVASLTPEQVEKKRAIDRENQRHCRAKTKSRIRALEEKVAELTGQLRVAEAQISYYQQREHAASGSEASSGEASNASRFPTYTGSSPEEQNSVWTSKEVVTRPVAAPLYDVPRAYSDPKSARILNYPLDFGTGITLNAGSGGQDEVDFMGLGFVGSIDLSTPPMPTFPDMASASMTQWEIAPNSIKQASDLQPWQRVPLHVAPVSKLEHVIIETTNAWRARFKESGHQDAELSEPVFPSISSLLNPETSEEDNGTTAPIVPRTSRPLSNVVAAQTYRTPLKTLPERLGFMFVLSHLLRWLVCRTKESYDAMPEYLRPTELQRTVAHPAWIDTIVWPDVRDLMITQMDWGRFEELRSLSGGSLSVNWGLSGNAAVVEAPDKQSLMLSPAFEAHVRNMENWTMGNQCTRSFPFLKACLRRKYSE